MFNFFKKSKKENENLADYSVLDLDKGFVFDYDLKSWVVEKSYEYDWGNECFSLELKISDGIETHYLSVEEDDEVELILSEKVNVNAVYQGLHDYVAQHNKPPDRLEYKGHTFYFDEENSGYFRDQSKGTGKDDSDWAELISWNYYDEKEKFNLCIEQWGEKSFEASYGKIVQKHEISNILPGS